VINSGLDLDQQAVNASPMNSDSGHSVDVDAPEALGQTAESGLLSAGRHNNQDIFRSALLALVLGTGIGTGLAVAQPGFAFQLFDIEVC